jgi:hypothetical protein
MHLPYQGDLLLVPKVVVLEHLHPAVERQALEMRFEGLQTCIKFL